MKFYILLVVAAVNVQRSEEEIYVKRPGYALYSQQQVTRQHNTFEIVFKTLDATGMLIHASSAVKHDYMTIELIKGRIRYAAEYGKATKNYEKRLVGYHQMWVGENLADNQWHKVQVTQNVLEITIIIDGRREPRFFAYRKAPPAPDDFSVQKVYVGGMYSFTGVPEVQSNSREGLTVCIKTAYMNGIDLIYGSKTKQHNIDHRCPTEYYYPIHFPNSVSHLSQKKYIANEIRVKFDFKTVIGQQMIMNYTNTRGARLEVGLTRHGKVYIGIQVDNKRTIQVMETGMKNFHDGQWHTTEYYISNKKPSYEAEFIVDGVRRKSRFSDKYSFNAGPLNFGYGYTGCMRNLQLNKKTVDYTLMENVATLIGKCKLADFCTPNPCIHGGRCNQTDTNFLCECRHTDYTGSCCQKSRFNHTCMEIRAKGEVRSDNYYLDMDGISHLAPFKAFCRMGKTPEDTITQVNQTHAYDVQVSNPTGKYFLNVFYRANEESLREVIRNHAFCRQYVRYRCIKSYLFKSPIGPPKARWLGLDNNYHYYWGSADGKKFHCHCGIKGNCLDKSKYCNCDARFESRNKIIEDRGYLDIIKHLPMMRVEYYDVNSADGSEAISSIGAIECYGYGGKIKAATFREPYSFIELLPDWRTYNTDWNNHMDVGDIQFGFKTVRAEGVMIYARGPVSGDFVQIEIVGRTRIRSTINLGYYKDLHLDVDIRARNRTFDDNDFHELLLSWNRKEMNMTVDNITRTVGFHFHYGITHLDLDGSAFYVGGSADNQNGYVGCMRDMYISGKIIQLSEMANNLERIGVYSGCGAACKLVKSPCNQGFCIDKYNNFTCNCSVSPFAGNHCQSEQNAQLFANGQYVQYDIAQKGINVQEAYITASFKTSRASGVIFQLHGFRNSHMSCFLINGKLNFLFNFQPDATSFSTITIQRRADQKGFNDNLVHVVRVHQKGNQIFAYLLDNKDAKPKVLNITGVIDFLFQKPDKLYAGKVSPTVTALPSGHPTTFVGCMSGVKYQFLPAFATTGMSIDLFALYAAKNTRAAGTARRGKCMLTDLPVPGPLPTVLPPLQFNTAAPTQQPIGPSFSMIKMLVVGVIGILVLLVVILCFITCRSVENYNRKYKPLREEARGIRAAKKGVPLTTVKEPIQKAQQQSSYQPQPTYPPQASFQPKQNDRQPQQAHKPQQAYQPLEKTQQRQDYKPQQGYQPLDKTQQRQDYKPQPERPQQQPQQRQEYKPQPERPQQQPQQRQEYKPQPERRELAPPQVATAPASTRGPAKPAASKGDDDWFL